MLDEIVGQLKQLVEIDDPLGRLSSEYVEGVAEVHRLGQLGKSVAQVFRQLRA